MGASGVGFQLGYAAILQADVENAKTKYQHGIDMGVTFSWTEFIEPPQGPPTRKTITFSKISGAIGMASAFGITAYPFIMEDPDAEMVDRSVAAMLIGVFVGLPMAAVSAHLLNQ